MDKDHAIPVGDLPSERRDRDNLHDIILSQGEIVVVFDHLNIVKPDDHNQQTKPKIRNST